MSDYKVSGTDLTSVADAIRTKGGTSASLSFPDGFVTAIGNISGGGSTLITKSITANGTYNASDDSADGYSSVTVAVPTSGSSQYVTGSFTGSTEGAAMDVTIPYSGSGYPILGMIYPINGSFKDGDTLTTLVQKSVSALFMFVKNDFSTSPNYTANESSAKAEVVNYYKNSDSSATSYGAGRSHENRLYNSGSSASAYSDSVVRISSSTSMSVYIADSSYGFKAGVEYGYTFMYSS